MKKISLSKFQMNDLFSFKSEKIFSSRSIEWNLIQPKEIRSKFNIDQIKRQRDSEIDRYDHPSFIDQVMIKCSIHCFKKNLLLLFL